MANNKKYVELLWHEKYDKKEFTVKIKPLTPIWTGNENRKSETLRETGIIGSLRWWYEALVRGLGGYACDPTNTKCEGENHCVACELFGCTGWARKFRLEVEKDNEILTLKFIKLREIKKVEWILLNETLKIIEKHGAFGGKLSDPHYGLIEIKYNELENRYPLKELDIEYLISYLSNNMKGVENPNLKRFIFINRNTHLNIRDVVKKLKSEETFLKGKLGTGKRYFYKVYRERPYRLFLYAVNNKEYTELVEFLRSNSVNFTEGKNLKIFKLLEGSK